MRSNSPDRGLASWWQQVPVFSRRYKVIVFDHRGFGRSRCDSEHFEAEYFPRDIAAILDAEGIGRAAGRMPQGV